MDVSDPSTPVGRVEESVATLIDISPPIGERTEVFPGDTRLTRQVLLDLARGDPITLSTLHSTVHVGAHADAPSHYGRDGRTIERMELERYLGPCVVVEAKIGRGERVDVRDLVGGIEAVNEPRVLIRTGAQPDKQAFNPDFAALEPALVHALADRGVMTIGIDTPSVDLSDSKDLPAHRAMLERDVAILEGLVLDRVEVGRYELIALPLRLVGFDASPVRAVLRAL